MRLGVETVKVQAKIRESNVQGCIATKQRVPGSPPKMTAAENLAGSG